MREGTILLRDGRRIGYAEYGVADGIPVFEFHGLPGGRFYSLREDALGAAGARLVSLERPGFGLSDPLPGRTVLDWASDVAEVADAFGFDRFGVLGVSAGAPNALACGYALADRVGAVGIACALGPVFDNAQFDAILDENERALLPIARADFDTAIALVRDFLKPTAEAWALDPDAYFDVFVEEWSEADRDWFRAKRDLWMNCLRATYERGVDTPTAEVAASIGPWGFDPADLRVPVHAWHGTIDPAPIDVIRFLVDRIPGATLTEYEGEAHALDEKHHDEWLAALTAWAR